MPDDLRYSADSSIDDQDLYKALVRLVAGGIGEGVDRLKGLTAELDAASHDPESAGALSFTANPLAMTLVGWVSEWPDQISSARSSAQRMTYPLTTLLGVVYDTGATVAEATGIASLLASLTEPAREVLAQELERLSMVGTAEYARGRVLSVQAFERSIDGIVGYLGESEEVGELVREQTLGITGAAVRELRETGAAADGLAEGVFRRLLGRTVRPLPPTPAIDQQ